jgi:TonB-dependent receptor
VGKFLLADESMSAFRMFTEQDETLHDVGIDWNITFYQWDGLSSKLQAGTAYLHRARDFKSRRFRFIPRSTEGIDLSQPIEDILRPWNINEYNYELNETTRPTDSYNAGQEVKAGYLMLDLPITGNLRLAGGGRYEWSDTNVDTFNLFKKDERITTKLKDEDILPAVNLTYSITKDMSVRAGYSKTLSRPEFHELAPFEFTDVRGGRTIKGNPDLKTAHIENYDLRWEWFLGGGDLISISGFYKDFDDAIERTIQPTIELRTTFVNADSAWLYGVEFELRKNLGFMAPWLDNFNIIGNYIYSQSESETEPKPGFVATNTKRAMEGQADHIYNITLEYDNSAWGFTGRVLYNFTDERITDIGGLGLPDIILEETNVFDIVLIKKIKENLTFKVVAENITNEGVRYTQGGKLFEKYKLGINFKVGVSYSW